MCKLRDAEAKLLLTALPSGILDKIKGATLDDAGTSYHTALQGLLSKGYVAEHTIGSDKDVRHNMIAYYITQAGYNALLGYLPDNHPLQACSDVSVNIRKGMSNEKVHRMVRMAAAADMMMCAGIRLPLDCIVAGASPYVLGPGRECSGCVTLGDHIRTAMRDAAVGLPPVSTGWVYVPADMIEASAMVYTSTGRPGTHAHAAGDKCHYNDVLGLLVDLDRHNCMAITKTGSRFGGQWQSEAYQRLGWRMMRFGLPSADHQTGIVLCDTPEAVWRKAKDADKYKTPYQHVLPITTDRQGVQMLSDIVSVGLDAYLRQHVDAVLEAVPKLRCTSAVNPLASLKFGNVCYYVGTVIDYCLIGHMQTARGEYGLVCYASQRARYEALVRPKEIIVIPDR